MSMLIPASATASRCRRPSGLVGHPDDGDLASLRSWATPAMIRSFHGASFAVGVLEDPGALVAGPRRADVDRDAVPTGIFDTAQVQDLGPVGGQVEHLSLE
jgi:hypothetical protein